MANKIMCDAITTVYHIYFHSDTAATAAVAAVFVCLPPFGQTKCQPQWTFFIGN